MWVIYVQFDDGNGGYFQAIEDYVDYYCDDDDDIGLNNNKSYSYGTNIKYSQDPAKGKKYPDPRAAQLVEEKLKKFSSVEYVTSVEYEN